MEFSITETICWTLVPVLVGRLWWWLRISLLKESAASQTEVPGGNLPPVPLCPPQILHDLSRARTQTTAVMDNKRNACFVSCPLSLLGGCDIGSIPLSAVAFLTLPLLGLLPRRLCIKGCVHHPGYRAVLSCTGLCDVAEQWGFFWRRRICNSWRRSSHCDSQCGDSGLLLM
jgi:hypothetical protein